MKAARSPRADDQRDFFISRRSTDVSGSGTVKDINRLFQAAALQLSC